VNEYIVEVTPGYQYVKGPSSAGTTNVDVIFTDSDKVSTEYLFTCVNGQAIGGKLAPERAH
jgi:hypothetical protein